MKRRLWFFVPFVLAITVIAASGAGQPQSATGLAASTESSGSMPKVASAVSASNPEMQRLDRAFGGTWSTSESSAHTMSSTLTAQSAWAPRASPLQGVGRRSSKRFTPMAPQGA